MGWSSGAGELNVGHGINFAGGYDKVRTWD